MILLDQKIPAVECDNCGRIAEEWQADAMGWFVSARECFCPTCDEEFSA